jgi:hypothetical protein
MKGALPALLALMFGGAPLALKAQFTWTTNDGTITITGYNGAGGCYHSNQYHRLAGD